MRKQVLAVTIGVLLVLSVFSVLQFWQIKPAYATSGSFGYTTVGTYGVVSINQTVRGDNYTVPADCEVDNITAYLTGQYGGGDTLYAKCSIHLVSDNTLISDSTTDERSWSNELADGWYTFTYGGTKPTLTSGTKYYLSIDGSRSVTDKTFTIYYDNTGGYGFSQSLAYASYPPATLTPSTNTHAYSLYANYTETGAAGQSGTELVASLAKSDYYIVQPNATYYSIKGSDNSTLISSTNGSYVMTHTVSNLSSGNSFLINCSISVTGVMEPPNGNHLYNFVNATLTLSGGAVKLFDLHAQGNVTFSGGTYLGQNNTVAERGIKSWGANNITVGNATFHGFGQGMPLDIASGSNMLIENCTFGYNANSTAIDFNDISDSVIARNAIDLSGLGQGIGVFSYTDSHSNVNITYNTVLNWGQNPNHGWAGLWHAIYIAGTPNSFIHSNIMTCTYAAAGVSLLAKSRNITIYNNTMGIAPNWGMHIYREDANDYATVSNLQVYNNTFANLTSGGIYYTPNNGYSIDGVNITDNTFSNTTAGSAIWIDTTTTDKATNTTIAYNNITTYTYGVRVGEWDSANSHTDGLIIKGNNITSCSVAIELENQTIGVTLSDNAFADNTQVLGCAGTAIINPVPTAYNNTGLTGYNMLNTSSVGAGYTSPSGTGWQYISGTNVSETWTPNSGHSRVDFSIDGVNQTTTTSPINITMSADRQTIAYFSGSPPPIILTITSPTNTTYTSSTVSVELSASGGTVDKIIWNCTFTSGTVVYANQTYTVATSMTLLTGSYIFHAVANNTDGNIDAQTVWFSVMLSGGSNQLIVNVWWSGYW